MCDWELTKLRRMPTLARIFWSTISCHDVADIEDAMNNHHDTGEVSDMVRFDVAKMYPFEGSAHPR